MKRLLAAMAVVAVAVPMFIGVAGLPAPGDASAPAHVRVAAHYVEAGPRETGAENLVTGVLLNYRAYDTFGEVLVIFAALAAVSAVLSRGSPGRPSAEAAQRIAVSPVVAFVIRLTAPFVAIFGAMVILKGHLAPGGGFQGGVILGALLVLLSVVLGRGLERPLIPAPAARWLQASGPLAFAAVAFFGLACTGTLLGYPSGPEAGMLRAAMMLVLELGIGIGGATIILWLFLEMRGE